MTLDELRALLRVRLDDTVETYLYSDATLASALNDAVRQAAIRKRLLLDRTTAECCSYAVTADPAATGATEVLLHPRVLVIRSARYGSGELPLLLTTLKLLERDDPTWPSTPPATPTHLVVDAQSGAVLLHPPPSTSGALTLAVWRAPLEAEEMEDGSDEPVVDEVWHRDLLDWAEHLVYLSKDGESGDAMRADAAAARFTAKFGRLPSAHELKCWALSPVRGQRAAFL